MFMKVFNKTTGCNVYVRYDKVIAVEENEDECSVIVDSLGDNFELTTNDCSAFLNSIVQYDEYFANRNAKINADIAGKVSTIQKATEADIQREKYEIDKIKSGLMSFAESKQPYKDKEMIWELFENFFVSLKYKDRNNHTQQFKMPEDFFCYLLRKMNVNTQEINTKLQNKGIYKYIERKEG